MFLILFGVLLIAQPIVDMFLNNVETEDEFIKFMTKQPIEKIYMYQANIFFGFLCIACGVVI